MMLYNYDNLLNAVREIKTNKTIAENERTMNKRNKLLRLENELKSSGILDDWYDLKRTCRELNIRIMPLQRVYTKMGQTMEETMAIKKCN